MRDRVHAWLRRLGADTKTIMLRTGADNVLGEYEFNADPDSLGEVAEALTSCAQDEVLIAGKNCNVTFLAKREDGTTVLTNTFRFEADQGGKVGGKNVYDALAMVCSHQEKMIHEFMEQQGYSMRLQRDMLDRLALQNERLSKRLEQEKEKVEAATALATDATRIASDTSVHDDLAEMVKGLLAKKLEAQVMSAFDKPEEKSVVAPTTNGAA